MKCNCISSMVKKYSKVKNASNKTLSRAHYINFLKAEDKFFNSAEKLNEHMDNCSLKAIPEFFKSVDCFIDMAAEKLKSVYYFQK